MPQIFTFTQGDPLNTTLINSDGIPEYTVKTTKKVLQNRVTMVTRVDSAGETVVARIEWIFPYEGRSTVEFHGGAKQRVPKFLNQKKLFWPPEWYMTCTDGKEYKWVNWNNLIDNSGRYKARYTRAGFEFKAMRWRKAMLELNDDGPMSQTDKTTNRAVVDQIVVAVIFTEQWRRWSSQHPIDA